MLAIFKTGGKQYSVKAGQILKVEKLEGKIGDNISFKNILAISDTSDSKIGTPLVEGAIVEAKILNQVRNKKIIVFKKKKRKNYRSTKGHRQYITVLKIESISTDGKKFTSAKKEFNKKEIPIVKKAKKEIKKTTKTTKKTPSIKKLAKKTATKNNKKPSKKDK